jgi:hypothetical protein
MAGMEADDRAEMGVFPFAVDLDVVVVVIRSDPSHVITLARRVRAQEIPNGLGAIAVHPDNWVHSIMLAEADQFAQAREQLCDRSVALRNAEILAAVPDAILGEERYDSLRVVTGIADRTIARLELLDRLDVLKPGDTFGEIVGGHRRDNPSRVRRLITCKGRSRQGQSMRHQKDRDSLRGRHARE